MEETTITTQVSTSILKDPKILEGVFGVFLVATIMTLAEIVLFFFIIKNDIVSKFSSVGSNLADTLKEQLNDKTKNLQNDPTIQDVLNRFKALDIEKLSNQASLNKSIFDLSIISTLLTSLQDVDGNTKMSNIPFIRNTLNFLVETETKGLESIQQNSIEASVVLVIILLAILIYLYYLVSQNGGKISYATYIFAFLTVGILASFQVYFYYNVGSKYNYPNPTNVVQKTLYELKNNTNTNTNTNTDNNTNNNNNSNINNINTTNTNNNLRKRIYVREK